jgi:hypothetical protein
MRDRAAWRARREDIAGDHPTGEQVARVTSYTGPLEAG